MENDGKSCIDKNLTWIFSLFFTTSFFYLWIFVNPALIFQHQQPVFFTGTDYLKMFLSYPGGMAEYVSNLLSQLYRFSALGALVITLVIAGITISAHHIFQKFNGGRPVLFVSLLIAGMLMGIHGGYFYTLSFSLAILSALLFFLLYSLVFPRNYIIRFVLYAVFSALVYYTAAAVFFLFVLLSVLYEVLVSRDRWPIKSILSILYIALAFLWPLLANSVFLFSAAARYSFLLPFSIHVPLEVLPEILVVTLLLAPALLGSLEVWRGKKSDKGEPKKRLKNTLELVLLSLIFIAAVITAFYSVDQKHRQLLRIDKFAEEHQWDKVIETAQRHPDIKHKLITLHYNRALYHTNQLCDNLFTYNQIEGENGLYRTTAVSFDMPLQMSALIFEMGNPNSAQMWANEALSIEGESAHVLKQAALVHLQKKEFGAADVYINKLSKTLFNGAWVKHYKNLVENPALIKNDPMFAGSSSALHSNFLIRYGAAFGELKYLHETNPANRMAFEYFAAYHLLSRRLDRLVKLLPEFLQMQENYPRHVEEAVILIAMSGAKHNIDLKSTKFRQDYVDNFNEFISIIAQHENNTRHAQTELAEKFGDTYWYYHLYHQPQELSQ